MSEANDKNARLMQGIIRGERLNVQSDSRLRILRICIRRFLEQITSPEGWTLQGFGMLRYYLSQEIRLHIWDSRFRAENVSMIHTHPWDFESLIIAGVMENQRLAIDGYWEPRRFNRQKILCGTGGGLIPEPVEQVFLGRLTGSPELYAAGDTYIQKAHEIHLSIPSESCVTIVERKFQPDRDHAYVFWPHGEEWVSAEPRPATMEEVRQITQDSLARFF